MNEMDSVSLEIKIVPNEFRVCSHLVMVSWWTKDGRRFALPNINIDDAPTAHDALKSLLKTRLVVE